jgi:hypothetical protein
MRHESIPHVYTLYRSGVRYAEERDGWIKYDGSGLKGTVAERFRRLVSERGMGQTAGGTGQTASQTAADPLTQTHFSNRDARHSMVQYKNESTWVQQLQLLAPAGSGVQHTYADVC